MKIWKCNGKKLILKEMKKSYQFFIKESNNYKNSKGYGLIRDKTILANEVASIAYVGYGIAALIIGIEHSWISYQKAYDRVNRTLETFLNDVEGKNGFYYHFVNMENGKREWYRNKNTNYFYMGYRPEEGFWRHWDMYAEQLMLYILGAGSPTLPIDKSIYDVFEKSGLQKDKRYYIYILWCFIYISIFTCMV